MPEISIIVPVYKVEPFLDRCIKSIVEQTLEDLELILINDGSPDNCPMICDAWAEKDSRIKVIHKTNGGLSDARNAGLDIATGKYIGFVDSDDYIKKDMYEILLNVLNSTGADFIKSNYISFEEETIPVYESVETRITVFNAVEALENFMNEEYSCEKPMKSTIWDGLYKKELFSNIRFPKGKINEDTFIFPELILKAKKIVHINEAFYYYYKRPGSIVHSGINEREINSRNLWVHIGNVMENFTDKFREKCCINSVSRYLSILSRIYFSTFKDEYFSSVRKELIEYFQANKQYINNVRIKRTLKIIRCYPLYLILRKVFKKHYY